MTITTPSEEGHVALHALLSLFDAISQHRDQVHNSFAWIYWKSVLEAHFVHEATFQLSLISSRSGQRKIFSLPIYLIPRLFQACLDVGDSEYSHSTQLLFSAPDPHTSNIQWSIMCNNVTLTEIEGKVTLDYVIIKDPSTGSPQARFKHFHFVAHSVASSTLSSPTIDGQLRPYSSIDRTDRIVDLVEGGIDESIEILYRTGQSFNEYGLTKKAMRTMEMYDIWYDMSAIMDMSVNHGSSPVTCVQNVLNVVQDSASSPSFRERVVHDTDPVESLAEVPQDDADWEKRSMTHSQYSRPS